MPEQSETRLSYRRVDREHDYCADAIADIDEHSGQVKFWDKEYAGVRWYLFDPGIEEREQVQEILDNKKHLALDDQPLIDLYELRRRKACDMPTMQGDTPGKVPVLVEQPAAACMMA